MHMQRTNASNKKVSNIWTHINHHWNIDLQETRVSMRKQTLTYSSPDIQSGQHLTKNSFITMLLEHSSITLSIALPITSAGLHKWCRSAKKFYLKSVAQFSKLRKIAARLWSPVCSDVFVLPRNPPANWCGPLCAVQFLQPCREEPSCSV